MKSYTDLEQCKKLSKILLIESADMWFANGMVVAKDGIEELDNIEGVFHCWSLAALLKILSKVQHPTLMMNAHGKWICDMDNILSFTYEPTAGDNPVDACYEMILKLHELNLL